MYVCFGFSLARLSRARTINLQCQSLSLRRAFLLRSACLSCVSACRSRSLSSSKDDRAAMAIALSPSSFFASQRVSVGLLLARSCQARTIELQCQSLSLRRAFLLRSVCLSCMSVSVSRSLAYVEQGRSTCNVNRYLSVELFCFAACACHCT